MTKDEIVAEIQSTIIKTMRTISLIAGNASLSDEHYASASHSILFTGDQDENKEAIEEIQEALESNGLVMEIRFVKENNAMIAFPNATKADLENLSTDTFYFTHQAPGLK